MHDCLCENGKYNKYTRNRLVIKIEHNTMITAKVLFPKLQMVTVVSKKLLFIFQTTQ